MCRPENLAKQFSIVRSGLETADIFVQQFELLMCLFQEDFEVFRVDKIRSHVFPPIN